MTVPMAGKTEFECPPNHLEALRADLPNITHVLIVGWRAAEAHAIELLGGSEPRQGLSPAYSLGVVSGSPADAAEVLHNLDGVARKGRLTFVEPDGFAGFTQKLDVHMADLLGPNLTATEGD